MELKYIVTETDLNKSIKNILLSEFHISHRLLTTLKKEKQIFLNEKDFIYTPLKVKDVIKVSFDYEEDNSNIVPRKMDLKIVYEDEWMLIVNKPSGIPVHPSILHYEDSLSNGIKYYFDSIGLKKKIRPITRIDKDTSGLVIFAKCEYIQEELIRQMENNTFKKEYIAIVHGIFDNKQGIINAPIARKENSIIERCIDNNGSPSVTEYEVIKEDYDNNFSVIKCNLKTGRTHQIRVHMCYIGHPLLGDDLYGGKMDLINRQALHCNKLSFIHPITKENINLEADFPTDILEIVNKIKKIKYN
ncbi:MAG: RluA family pseudouridine synthase [Clostridia bacterium]|nr:RluA family pseudouridine synthase [Clostridia bacterium]